MANHLEQIAVEIEQTVLGMLITEPSLIERHNLTAADFGEPIHAEMFVQIAEKARTGQRHTATTLGHLLSAEPPIGNLSIPEYVRRVYRHSFENQTPGTIDALKDVATRRRLALVAESLKWACHENRTNITAEAADALSQLDSVLSANRLRKTRTTLGQATEAAIDAILNDDGKTRVSTGLDSVDDVLGGWHRGQFCIIAGRPGMGKSMLAFSTAIRAAKRGAGVMAFSLEMTAHEIACRAMSDISFSHQRPIPYRMATTGGLSDSQIEKWARIAVEYSALPFVIDDQRGLTVSEIAARARAQRTEFEANGQSLDVILVDHLGLIRASDRYRGNRVQEVGEISDGLATLAKELDVCVVALSQLNRGTEGRENKRPTLADLRDSGAIEQDAHVVTFAFRQSYYLERTKYDPGTQEEQQRLAMLEACNNTMELLVAKNRNGPTEMITLFCEPSCNAVRDLQR